MRLLPLFLSIALAGSTAFVIQACSDDSSTGDTPEGTDSGSGSETGTKPGLERDSSAPGEDASKQDSSTIEDAGCTVAVPSLDAGGGCGTMEFGAVAAPFTGVDAGGGDAGYVGGAFPAGIYDAEFVESGSSINGMWRETFVSDGNGHFTRIRQITLAAAGPVTRRSGTYTTKGNQITFTYDCAQSNGNPVEAGTDTLPYEVLTDKCAATYRYGATGFRVNLKRR